MKIYSLNQNILQTNRQADRFWVKSKIINYHKTLEAVNTAIKRALFSFILDNKLVGEELEKAKNNKIKIRKLNSKLNFDTYPIFFFKEINVEG